MLHLELNVRPKTAKRLKKVLEYSRDEEMFAQNIIAHQIAELKRGIFHIKLDMKAYEEKYKMSSAGFYKRFKNGKTDDREDYLAWAGLYEMMKKNMERLEGLEG